MHYSHVWTTIIYAEGSSILLLMYGSSINLIRTARSNQIPFLPSESILWFTGSCSIAAVRAHVLFKREEYRFIAPHKKTKLSECSVFKLMDWSRWIHHWPTISQYLSCLDSFLWENLKSFIHETSIDSPEDVVARISVAAVDLYDMPIIFQQVLGLLHRRLKIPQWIYNPLQKEDENWS